MTQYEFEKECYYLEHMDSESLFAYMKNCDEQIKKGELSDTDSMYISELALRAKLELKKL